MAVDSVLQWFGSITHQIFCHWFSVWFMCTLAYLSLCTPSHFFKNALTATDVISDEARCISWRARCISQFNFMVLLQISFQMHYIKFKFYPPPNLVSHCPSTSSSVRAAICTESYFKNNVGTWSYTAVSDLTAFIGWDGEIQARTNHSRVIWVGNSHPATINSSPPNVSWCWPKSFSNTGSSSWATFILITHLFLHKSVTSVGVNMKEI